MEREIVFYVSSRWREADSGMRFSTDRLENVLQIAEKFKYDSDEVYVQSEEHGLVLLKDYLKKLREAGIENISVFWSFLERVKRVTKSTGNKKAIVDLFNELPADKRKELYDLYQKLDNKLTNVLDEAYEAYEEKNPSFHLSEDGMMDFLPYMITLGEKRVATFMKKPHLALKLSQEEYEYPFNLLDVFLKDPEGV